MDALGSELAKVIVDAVMAKVDINHPSMAPYVVSEEHLSLQIYRGTKRQPMHLDSGVGWYHDEKGQKWAPLSVVVNLNDAAGTHLPGPPVSGIFDLVRDHSSESGVTKLTTFLKRYEQSYDQERDVENKAGQILSFHPGEQVHCGISTNTRCSLTGGIFVGRIVLFIPVVPGKFKNKAKQCPLFSTEYPWGLQQQGITLNQVESEY